MRDAMMLAVGLACGIAWQYMLDARKRDELRKLRRHAAEHAAEAAELRAKRSAASLRGWRRRRNAKSEAPK